STPSPQSGSSFGRIQTSGLFVTRGSHRTPSLLFFWSRSPHLTLPQAGHDSFRIPPGNLRTEGVWYENCSIQTVETFHHTGGNHNEKGPDCRGHADPGSVPGGVGVMGPDGLD